MIKIRKKEKEEILKFVKSKNVKEDFCIIRKNQKKDITLDEYIKFLNLFQRFSGAKKEFHKIKDSNFKL